MFKFLKRSPRCKFSYNETSFCCTTHFFSAPTLSEVQQHAAEMRL